MVVKVRIWRTDPDGERPSRFETFQVPLPGAGRLTAMDLLDYIRSHFDATLAYFRHSACDRGLCRQCAVRINGRPALLCEHVPEPGIPLVLEPLSRRRVVRDLVCRPGPD